jgi:hypothetical protein
VRLPAGRTFCSPFRVLAHSLTFWSSWLRPSAACRRPLALVEFYLHWPRLQKEFGRALRNSDHQIPPGELIRNASLLQVFTSKSGQALDMTEDPSKTPWWRSWTFWIAAISAFAIYMSSGRKAPVSDKTGVTSATAVALSPREIEDTLTTQLREQLQSGFDKNKQQLFNAFHPVGTAKSVVVHDVSLNGWKHGQATARPDEILGFSIRFTIYWEGPLVKDGFTKVAASWDNESQRWLPGQVLATNGMTNAQATSLFIDIAGAAFAEALRNRGN